MSSDSIFERLDAAFDRAIFRYPESPVKWIYFTTEDWEAFDAAKSAEWGGPVHAFSYRDVQIRPGETSRLVTDRGCLVQIPKRLSPRVRAA